MFDFALVTQSGAGTDKYLALINAKYGTLLDPDVLSYEKMDMKLASTVPYFVYDKLAISLPMENASNLMKLETKMGATLNPVFALNF
jgi:hypothetical protein